MHVCEYVCMCFSRQVMIDHMILDKTRDSTKMDPMYSSGKGKCPEDSEGPFLLPRSLCAHFQQW